MKKFILDLISLQLSAVIVLVPSSGFAQVAVSEIGEKPSVTPEDNPSYNPSEDEKTKLHIPSISDKPTGSPTENSPQSPDLKNVPFGKPGNVHYYDSTDVDKVTDLDPLDASATGQEETTEETETLAKQIGLASRGLCGTLATDPLIAGFFVSGNTSKSVIVTAKGPSLSAEISDFLPNPSLYVVNGTTGQLVGSLNDDWQNSTDVTNITNSGRAPSSDLDSAIILYDLEPGPYSAICYDSSDATGTALIEVYEYDDGETEDAKFDGLATRGYCGPLASEPRIVGFFVGGDDGESIDVYVGAKGPSLATEGVASPISDPAIYVVNGTTGALVGSLNDNWADGADAEKLTEIGRAPTATEDAALILRDLTPGPYSAVAYGIGDVSGTVLVEVYEVDLGE